MVVAVVLTNPDEVRTAPSSGAAPAESLGAPSGVDYRAVAGTHLSECGSFDAAFDRFRAGQAAPHAALLSGLNEHERQVVAEIRSGPAGRALVRALDALADAKDLTEPHKKAMLQGVVSVHDERASSLRAAYEALHVKLSPETERFLADYAQRAACDFLSAGLAMHRFPAKQAPELLRLRELMRSAPPGIGDTDVEAGFIRMLGREGQERLNRPEGPSVLLARDAEGVTVLQHLVRIAQDDFPISPVFTKNGIAKWEVLANLMHALAAPERIFQGYNGTCAAGAEEYVLKRDPGRLAAMVESLLRDGCLTLPDAQQITLTADFLGKDDSARSTLSRILQCCFMEHGNGEDWLYSRRSDQSYCTTDDCAPGRAGLDGIGHMFLANSLRQEPHRFADIGQGSDREAMFQIVEALIRPNSPDGIRADRFCRVQIDEESQGELTRHTVVPLYRSEADGEERVYFFTSNTQGIRGKELTNPARRCEGEGVESMTVAEFAENVKSVLYPESAIAEQQRIGLALSGGRFSGKPAGR